MRRGGTSEIRQMREGWGERGVSRGDKNKGGEKDRNRVDSYRQACSPSG